MERELFIDHIGGLSHWIFYLFVSIRLNISFLNLIENIMFYGQMWQLLYINTNKYIFIYQIYNNKHYSI